MDEYRRHLYEALHAASRDYDQAVLTLAAATLALSVTFVHDIAPTPAEGTQLLLFVAWASLVVSLLSIIGSFLTSQRVLRSAIEALDGHGSEAHRTLLPKAETVTEALNWIAGIALAFGLAMLGVYALRNM